MKKKPKKKPVRDKATRRVRGREKSISTDLTNLASYIRHAQEEERLHDLMHFYGWKRDHNYDVLLCMWPQALRNSIGPELAKHAIAGTLHDVCRALKKNREASRKSNERRLIIDIIRKLRDEGGGEPPSYKDVCLATVKADPSVLERFIRKDGEAWPTGLERYVRSVAKEERLLLAELK